MCAGGRAEAYFVGRLTDCLRSDHSLIAQEAVRPHCGRQQDGSAGPIPATTPSRHGRNALRLQKLIFYACRTF